MSLSNHNKNSMENKVIARMASYNIMYHSHSQLSQVILSCNKENRADSDCLICHDNIKIDWFHCYLLVVIFLFVKGQHYCVMIYHFIENLTNICDL